MISARMPARFVSQITSVAKEVARRTDLRCVVAGPVEREFCVKFFTDPRMQNALQSGKSLERGFDLRRPLAPQATSPKLLP